MALKDVTADGVWRALAEFDALGRDVFLAKYGFGRSRAYKLVVDDREYDSKAIVGAAHGWSGQGLEPLSADAFSGGDATVRALLERLGFEVRSKPRNPDWSRDELILALDAYMAWRPSFPAKTSTEIAKLSAEIRALGELLHGISSDTFRNANGVYMKLMNFRRLEPGAGGEASGGLSGGSQADVEVWDAYAQNRTALATAAAAIRETLARVDADEDLRADLASAYEPEIAEATEGALVTRLHRIRERDPEIVRRKKADALKRHGKLSCDACGFDFAARYGARGEGYIECHHIQPLSASAERTTRLADMALLCANCHRMVHARAPWLSVDELRAAIVTSGD
ncbi:MAG: HNH endonuclease [Hyphomonadaceae bacterium]